MERYRLHLKFWSQLHHVASRHGAAPDYYRHLVEDIRASATKICPSVADLRDQDLRDTAVTWLALAGCDIWEICLITGHSFKTAAEVLKHYLAIHPDMATSAMNKMHIWYEGKTKK